MSASLKLDTGKTNIEHNNRTLSDKEKEKNPHIDPSRSSENKYLVQKDIKELYQDEFGEALEKYNAKQKRSDRKIKDYYKHIQSGKKTKPQQEMIIQVGDKDDFSSKENIQKANEILEEWFKNFEERNPNLKVYNAVIHNDEASPHLHINFVPVAENYKRGLEKQVSFNKAVATQDENFNQERPFEDWREKEMAVLEKLLNERGFERKLVGTNEYEDVNDYKEKKKLEQEIDSLNKDLADKKNELLALNKKVPDEINIQTKRQTRTVEVPTGEKNLFGKEKTKKEKQPTGNRIVAEEEFQKMMTAAKENQRLKTMLDSYLTTDIVKENKQLEQENEHLKSVIDEYYDEWQDLTKENRELKNENSELKAHIGDLTNEIKILYQTTKEYFKARTSDLKGALREFADKVKDKLPKSQFGRLQDTDERQEKENQYSINALKQMEQEIKRQNAMKKKNKKKSHDMEL